MARIATCSGKNGHSDRVSIDVSMCDEDCPAVLEHYVEASERGWSCLNRLPG